MKRFKLPKKATHIGAWLMPKELMDKIDLWWNENKDYVAAGLSGPEYEKDSMDLGIEPYDFNEPWGSYRDELQLCLNDFLNQFPEADKLQQSFNIHENYNLQRYLKGGGFKSWHHENAGDFQGVHRHLVFMTYIDDVPDAGTFFKYQDIVTPCVKGLTLIWPAGWTHTHKSQVTMKHEKRIITGWYNYDKMFDIFKDEIIDNI